MKKHLIVTGTLVGLLALSLTGCNTSSNATTSNSTTSSTSSSASSSAVQAMSQLEQELDTTEPEQETPDSSTITEEQENSPFSSVTPYTMYANTVVAIRLTPEDNAKESQNIQTNEKVTVIEEGSGDKVDWCKVKLESGTESYILKKWLSAEPVTTASSSLSGSSSNTGNSGNTGSSSNSNSSNKGNSSSTSNTGSTSNTSSNTTPSTPTPEPEPVPEPTPAPEPEPTPAPEPEPTPAPEPEPTPEPTPTPSGGPAPDQDKNGTSTNTGDYEFNEWSNSDTYKDIMQGVIDQGGVVNDGVVWIPDLA